MSNIRAAITAIGHYVPERVVDNHYFEKFLETSDEWIRTRTGIIERRWARDDEPTTAMAEQAVNMLLERRGISASEIEVIIFNTVTPDMYFPPASCILQNRIGATNAWGFDGSAACCSFLYGLETGTRFIESGKYKKVLVVGADKMSMISDMRDRNTCVLFGDAAACVLLEPSTNGHGIIDSILHIDGSGKDNLRMLGGGSLNPTSHETVDKGWHYVWQDGKTVFKSAVVAMADVSYEIMQKHNLTADDIAYLVPHQANLRIIDACRERAGLPPEKVMINIQKYGNTTSATIPLCLAEWWEAGKLKKGDKLVLASFGAGYTWGSILLDWAY